MRAKNSMEENVRQDLKFLRTYPLMRKALADHSYGFMHDIKTGLPQEVKA